MKLLSALLLTLAATSAMAMPAVNDAASYDVTVSQGGQSISGTQDLVITAYNATTKLYTVKSTSTFNGQTQVQEQTTTADKLVSDAAANQLLSNCAAQGGTLGQVTVPAGTLDACTLPVNENGARGTVSLGAVPFGLIKLEVANASQSMTLTLKAYTKGQ
ncbi:MAG TPA: hypothetical protein VFV50_14080 [Bdellovibrionales bacterium]|nr:hypothetical protein [Bdellovibrionales bacterium]